MMNSQRSDTGRKLFGWRRQKKALIKLLNTINLLITVKSLQYKTMLSYCLKCRNNTKNVNPKISKTNNG